MTRSSIYKKDPARDIDKHEKYFPFKNLNLL